MSALCLILILGYVGFSVFKQSFPIVFISAYLGVTILLPPETKLLNFAPTTIFTYLSALFAIIYITKKKKIDKKDKALSFIFIYYGLIYALMLPLGYEMTLSMEMQDIKMTIMELMIPLSMIVLIKKESQIDFIFKSFLAFSIIMCIYGLFCVLIKANPLYLMLSIECNFDDSFLNYMNEERGGLEGRYGGTIGHPLYYSVCVCVVFFINLFGYLRIGKTLLLKITYLILAILLIINIFYSGSRSSLLALIIGIVLLVSTNISFKKIAIFGILGYSMLIAASGFKMFGKYQPLIDSTVFFWDESTSEKADIEGSSVSMRIEQVMATFKEIEGPALFFGNGAGWPWWYTETKGQHPQLLGFESIIFSGLTEFGVIGFTLIYVLFFAMMFRVNKRLLKKTSNKAYKYTNIYLISYIIICLLTSPYFFTLFLPGYVLSIKSGLKQ